MPKFFSKEYSMESLIGEFPKFGKIPVLPSPEKSGENSTALWTNFKNIKNW